ncbi:hypothetical protein, partial [Pseudomonas syringae group genomosp. 7]|uniref:hypothetical protein n=1 Tax=Pseudomonas syringae group genomosp. 7 TaxID=251699 RepID=UPI00377047EE
IGLIGFLVVYFSFWVYGMEKDLFEIGLGIYILEMVMLLSFLWCCWCYLFCGVLGGFSLMVVKYAGAVDAGGGILRRCIVR